MVAVVNDFLMITGMGAVPTNIGELIPYLITVVVSVSLVSASFGLLGRLAEVIINFRRW